MYFSSHFSRTGLVALLIGLVVACGGGSDAPPAAISPNLGQAPSQAANSNVLPVYVDAGPKDTGYNVNRLYTTVTVCESGSVTRCQTIDHVLVDTGSTGLRLLAPAMASGLQLSRLTGDVGFPLLNCVQFIDNTYAWGTVATADILLGDRRAASVPIQIVADAGAGTAPPACSIGGDAITTAATLGANGIIGLGLFKADCGSRCANSTNNGAYYTCTDASCSASTGSRVGVDNQVKNPVPLFSQDNNGVVVALPPVSSPGVPRLDGSLFFGINTQLNNQLAGATVLTTNNSPYVTTRYDNRDLKYSFLDTGSNGFFFDAAFPVCSGGFYCPEKLTDLSATIQGANGATKTVDFAIDNAETLFVGGIKTALPNLSGNIGQVEMFDWGLPFFYGRRVFFAIEGQVIEGQPNVPFYAF